MHISGKILALSILISCFATIPDVYAQEGVKPKKANSSLIDINYFYGVQTAVISSRKNALSRILMFQGDPEQNFFKTHGLNLNLILSDKYQVGFGLKYGDNFYRSSSRRRHQLNNGDKDFDSFLSAGISAQINLWRQKIDAKDKGFYASALISAHLINFEGIIVRETFTTRSFREYNQHGFHGESGIVVGYLLSSHIKVNVLYQPISVQVGTYGFGFQYNAFGLGIKF